jgi:hypothetical protein
VLAQPIGRLFCLSHSMFLSDLNFGTVSNDERFAV